MPNVVLHPAVTGKVPWLDLPLISLPMPTDPEAFGIARISGSTIHNMWRGNRRTALWQAWAHLANRLPPIPNTAIIRAGIPKGGFAGSKNAIGVFQGIKRPHRSESDGNSVLVYVFNPTHTLAWHNGMGCVAKVVHAPADTVLVTYVDTAVALQESQEGVIGVITGWEFIPADPEVPTLPEKFGSRYGRTLWRR
jgi:hypothetical protein